MWAGSNDRLDEPLGFNSPLRYSVVRRAISTSRPRLSYDDGQGEFEIVEIRQDADPGVLSLLITRPLLGQD